MLNWLELRLTLSKLHQIKATSSDNIEVTKTNKLSEGLIIIRPHPKYNDFDTILIGINNDSTKSKK